MSNAPSVRWNPSGDDLGVARGAEDVRCRARRALARPRVELRDVDSGLFL